MSFKSQIPSTLFNVENVVIKEPKPFECSNGKKIQLVNFNYIYDNLKSPKVDKMYLTTKFKMNVSQFTDYEGNGKYKLRLYIRHQDIGESERSFFDNLHSLDNKVMEYTIKHANSIFGKEIDEDDIEDFKEDSFKGCISEKGPYPPSINVKIPTVYGTGEPSKKLEVWYSHLVKKVIEEPVEGTDNEVTKKTIKVREQSKIEPTWDKLKELLKKNVQVQVCVTPKFSSIPSNTEAFFSFELSSIMIYEKSPPVIHIVDSTEFNVDNVSLGAPKLKEYNGKKGLSTYFGYNKNNLNSIFKFEAKNMVTKYDLTDYQDDGNFSIVLMDNNELENNKSFMEQLNLLDNKMIDFGIEHSEKIFGKVFTPEQRNSVKKKYTGCVKENINATTGEKYLPTIKIKIPKDTKESINYSSKMTVNLINSDGKEVVTDTSIENLKTLLPKYSNVSVVFSPYIHFVNKKFGMSFRVVSIDILTKQEALPPRGPDMFGNLDVDNGDMDNRDMDNGDMDDEDIENMFDSNDEQVDNEELDNKVEDEVEDSENSSDTDVIEDSDEEDSDE